MPRSESKHHWHHLHQLPLHTCTAYTIIAKHKQIRAIYLDPFVLATTSTLIPVTLANPSSTQGFLVFICHPELNSRDVIPSSTRGISRLIVQQLGLTAVKSPSGGHVPPSALKITRSASTAQRDRPHRQADAAPGATIFVAIAWRNLPLRQVPPSPGPHYSLTIA
ncbi:hypothetical protein DEO72_LG7g1117 [Vigna unguiculata]|uniref:Uncharacterized protein n=1 Tax=Vigna unguiculata TaxID=3917 RepID=A0A4D6MH23_VIGUN|nr:hypothetical protein DEO72_LG7g1117 [Vigna unguiculata]